jgi:hypothetical protein
MRQIKTYYTVAISDSWLENGTPCLSQSCGHLHRSWEAANRCRQRLLNYRREAGSWVCSAKWYGSAVFPVDRAGKVLSQEKEHP